MCLFAPSYEHVNSLTLSLPLSPALTFLTILLPLLAAGNTFALPALVRSSNNSSSTNTHRRVSLAMVLQRLLFHPMALQFLQALVTTILATLYASDLVSSNDDCALATRWLRLFRTKDDQAIRAIQDAFQCCGFRSVHDMAWPFPPTAVECAVRFERALACRAPWTEALRRGAGVQFGVVLAVGLLQVSFFVVCLLSGLLVY